MIDTAAQTQTLFEPLDLRGVRVRNRLVVSPMCMYASVDGFATDWHLVHLGSRAVGGAGIVFTEAAAVEPRGRISQHDLGIWRDEHIEQLARINAFVVAQGAVCALQLAHAGRKGSVGPPWDPKRGCVAPEDGGWVPVAPSEERDMPHYPLPHALALDEIHEHVALFAAAAARAARAGFGIVEIHAAHGYLLHEFLTPLANKRTDAYGGSFENRVRFLLEVTEAVRRVWPDDRPLFVRISATDWTDGGWTLDDSVALAPLLAARGVDVIDVSSAGIGRSPLEMAAQAPGYQVPFADRIRHACNVKTMAVGQILDAEAANDVIASGHADLVAIGRLALGEPYFAYHAARTLGADLAWPDRYRRATLLQPEER
jgi:2,4-dienoyl-CoA reductase-like NADH-dependent reductase (Old Yellow Enzyme family)